MIKRSSGFCMVRFVLVVALVAAALPLTFVQSAFAERVEGPLRADPSAYEHLSDDEAIDDPSAQGNSKSDDGVMYAQAGGSSIVDVNLTLVQMANLEVNGNGGSHGYTYEKFLAELDPMKCSLTMFADLTSASGLTAAQIDRYIDSVANEKEGKGKYGRLHGLGYAFVRAEQVYSVNAAYLVAHAILETGWGSSELAKGYTYDGKTPVGSGTSSKVYPAGMYFNFFGIGAYDNSPLSGGRSMAIQEGWNTPEAAVMGGAKWISSNYTYSNDYPQKTLYNMKWDYVRASKEGKCWHQYATGIDWPKDIATLMEGVYAKNGIEPSFNYILPQYKGAQVPDTNARTLFRLYNPNSGEHLFTTDVIERDNLTPLGWKYEGLAWTSPKSDGVPVYRLYNPYSGDHHYTTKKYEYDQLGKIGWRQEGIKLYSSDLQKVPVYRLFNPRVKTGTHHYTTDKNEYDTLVQYGWKQEGIEFYGM